MRWLLISAFILVSGGLGIFTAFAGIDIFPREKITRPKPEKEIIGIDDSGNISFEITDTNQKDRASLTEATSEITLNDKYDFSGQKIFLLLATDVVYSGKTKVNSLGGRTDSLILVRLSENHLDLLSIPRDSRVEIPGHSIDKINHANVYGGPELVVETIEKWLEIEIDDYIMINTFGVVKLVDFFGGVYFNIPKRMYYADQSAGLYINLYPGYQLLDGLKVHNFLRFRHDALGDFNRVKRQQEIIKVMLEKVSEPDNLSKIPGALKILDEYISTSLELGEIFYLLNKSAKIDKLSKSITMNTVPGVGMMRDGVWYWVPNQAETEKIMTNISLKTVKSP